MTEHDIDIQVESQQADIPDDEAFLAWADAAIDCPMASITIRVVDEPESAHLNSTYRHKEGPTNVLSFPLSTVHLDNTLHGDIIICAPLVSKEANEQHKSVRDHWTHLTVHGLLHLQGYDHINTEDAQAMEEQEIKILAKLGVTNPYE